MEIIVLFTDTHFGVKNNSMTWLQSQLDFIYKQFIPELTELKRTHPKDRINLIHLGDVFDSRSTVSTYVATKVREAFAELRNVVDEFDIIAGNHDYYSPNSDEVCSIDLLLEGLGINLHTKDSYITLDGDLYLPWYEYQKVDKYSKVKAKRIFTHADIVMENKLYDVPVYSGHLHIPHIKERKGIYNIGSCYALNFADSNSDRGYYIITDDTIEFIPNRQSIKFWRLYNDEVFKNDITTFNSNDYVELYISEANMANDEYTNIIKQYTNHFTHLWIIPQVVHSAGTINEDFKEYDIASIMESLIPDDLQDFFKKVKTRLNN